MEGDQHLTLPTAIAPAKLYSTRRGEYPGGPGTVTAESMMAAKITKSRCISVCRNLNIKVLNIFDRGNIAPYICKDITTSVFLFL
jgi:hypothetical protein